MTFITFTHFFTFFFRINIKEQMSFGKCQFPVNSETEIHGNHTDFHINWHFLTFFDIFSWKCHIFPHLFNREIDFSCYSPGKFPHLPWFCTHIIVTFAHICSHFLTFFDIFWHFWHCTHIHLLANVIWYRPSKHRSSRKTSLGGKEAE